MDVRCDRCQTEYELDDDSVADAGASVQCTTCGYTFVVSRTGATIVTSVTPPVEPTDFTMPAGPDWLLATQEGQTHRFREPTTLQKWIVERRVSRDDRVSHRGGAWRRLGDVDELRPFFEVVDQADRAQSPGTDRTLHTPQPGTRRNPNTGRGRGGASLVADVGTTARQARPDVGLDLDQPAYDSTDDLAAAGLVGRRRKLMIAGGAGIALLAGGAFFFWFKDPHALHLAGDGHRAVAPHASETQAPPPARPSAAPSPPPAASPPTAAVGVPPASAPATPPSPPPAPVAPAGEPAHADASKTSSRPDPLAGKPRTYERLVAEADRALENGATNRAQKLYDEALKLHPDGVAAITGSAYLLLDRQRTLAAIGLFKRALTYAPTFPPALFGLGEAYRAQGEAARAIEAYKRYLAASPSGQDAPAARRQVKELSEGLSSRRAESARASDGPTVPGQ